MGQGAHAGYAPPPPPADGTRRFCCTDRLRAKKGGAAPLGSCAAAGPLTHLPVLAQQAGRPGWPGSGGSLNTEPDEPPLGVCRRGARHGHAAHRAPSPSSTLPRSPSSPLPPRPAVIVTWCHRRAAATRDSRRPWVARRRSDTPSGGGGRPQSRRHHHCLPSQSCCGGGCAGDLRGAWQAAQAL